MKNSFTTICLLRNIFLATMCTWSSVNVERWPLWDMNILRHDICPTATTMKDDHLETWFFCNYIIWSEKKIFPLLVRPTISYHYEGLPLYYYDLFETWSLCKIDLLRRNHFEIWTICNNNLFETWQWHYWDSIRLQQ